MVKITCLHGFFLFEEDKAGELSRFQSVFDVRLAAYGEYYTFDFLKNAPTYSIKGAAYLGKVALVTNAGKPWDILKANGFVYNPTVDNLVDFVDNTKVIKLVSAKDYYVANGFIFPGSLTEEGLRVMDYSAWYSFDRQTFRYTGVTLV